MAIGEGDIVKVDYEGKLEDGSVFDSSNHGDHSHPLEFEIGAGMMIPGFEEAVKGMNEGESKEFEIPSEKAYGERRDDLQREVPRNTIPANLEGKELEAGMVLMIQTPQGQRFPVNIVKADKETVTIDMNHPLAGKNLLFNVRILEIKKKA